MSVDSKSHGQPSRRQNGRPRRATRPSGEAAEALLDSDAFSSTVNQLVDASFQNFTNSTPDESVKRCLPPLPGTCISFDATTARQGKTRSSASWPKMTTIKRRMRTMNNVLDTSAERRSLDEAEDAILARWEDPQNGHPKTRQRRLWRSKKRRPIRQSLTRKTTKRSTEEETDPEETSMTSRGE